MKKTFGDNSLLKKYVKFKKFTDIRVGSKILLDGIITLIKKIF